MAQIAHCLRFGFDRLRVVLLDAGQPSVGEVERDADDGCSVRTSPLVAQVHRRPERHALGRELLVQLVDQLLEQCAADVEADV